MHDSARRIVRDGYDTVADEYLAARTAGGDLALLPELTSRVDVGDAVLDAGCGAGDPVTTRLVSAATDVVGLDLSVAQLRLARSRVPSASLVQADLSVLPFRDGAFRGLVSYYAVIHVPRNDHRAAFREFARVLRPGGVALLCLGAGDVPEDHDPESWLGVPMFWSHFDAETNLRMLREAGLDVKRHELVPDPMGHGHHLFALVARPWEHA